MKYGLPLFLLSVCLVFPLCVAAAQKKEIVWQGNTYSAKVRLILKDGRQIEGLVAGGEDELSVKLIPRIGGAEVNFPLSMLTSIELLPYDPTQENQGDDMVKKVEVLLRQSQVPEQSLEDARLDMDRAADIYSNAASYTREDAHKQRLREKIQKTRSLKTDIRNQIRGKTNIQKIDEHWAAIIEAEDRLDHTRACDLLLAHLEQYPNDERGHNKICEGFQSYEDMPPGEKTNACLILAKYLKNCADQGRIPTEEIWKKFPALYNDYLDSLAKPGSLEILRTFFQGAEAVKTIVENQETIRAGLGTWSKQVSRTRPIDYLRSSATIEVRQKHINALDKVKLLVELDPGKDTYELLAEWALNQGDVRSALWAYGELVKLQPGGDPKTEQLVKILEYLGETRTEMEQGEVKKAREKLMRVWNKKEDLPPGISKLVYNMVAQCDLFFLDQEMKKREQKAAFYGFILGRLSYFGKSALAGEFFNRFKAVLLLIPIRYDIRLKSQGTDVIPPSGMAEKVKSMVGQDGAFESQITLLLEMDLDVTKDLDRKIRTKTRKIRKDEDNYEYKTIYFSDYYLNTRRNVSGRFELKAEGYGILLSNPFHKSYQDRKMVGTMEGTAGSSSSVPNPRFSRLTSREDPRTAAQTSLSEMLGALDQSGLKSLAFLLQSVYFDPNRKIQPEGSNTPTPTPGRKKVQSTPDTNDTIVYIAPDHGKEYHYLDCPTLTRTVKKQALTVRQAKQMGYEPCGRCNPPR